MDQGVHLNKDRQQTRSTTREQNFFISLRDTVGPPVTVVTLLLPLHPQSLSDLHGGTGLCGSCVTLEESPRWN